MKNSWTRPWSLFIGVTILLSVCAPATWASLGRDIVSVKDDSAHLKAQVRLGRNDSSYSVHELTTPTGTVVREYVSAAGRVFGVAWRGPYLPDFRQILGDYYAPVMQTPREQRQGRGPIEVKRSGVVFQSGGHMRSFFGRAYVLEMLPKGISADVIQ